MSRRDPSDQRAMTRSVSAGVESVRAGGLQELRGKQGVTSRLTLFSVPCRSTRSSDRSDCGIYVEKTLIMGGSEGCRRYQGTTDCTLNDGMIPLRLARGSLFGGDGQLLKHTMPGGTFSKVNALPGNTVPVKKAEIPLTAPVARMLRVPGLTLTVIGAL